MATKIEPTSIDFDIGTITVEFDEFIKILEEIFEPNEIIFKHENYFLEGLDDIKEHKLLAAGNPKIICRNIEIEIRHDDSTVLYNTWVDPTIVEDDSNVPYPETVADNLANHLKKYRVYWPKVVKYSFIIPLLVAFLLLKYLNNKNVAQKLYDALPGELYTSIGALLIVIIAGSVLIAPIYTKYLLKHRQSIRYDPRMSFFQRNRDKILTAIITGLIVGLLMWTWNYLTGGPPPE